MLRTRVTEKKKELSERPFLIVKKRKDENTKQIQFQLKLTPPPPKKKENRKWIQFDLETCEFKDLKQCSSFFISMTDRTTSLATEASQI